MGLFGKPKKPKTKEDPEWAELRRFREKQKGHVIEGEEASPEPPTPPPGVSPEETPAAPEFRCKKCGSNFKESWNRCPKCGGGIVPLHPDRPGQIERLYPSRPGGVHRAKAPVEKAPKKGARPPGGRVKTVKKVRKVASPGAGKNREKEKIRDLEKDSMIDSMFEPDPLLDLITGESKAPHKRGSWRDVNPLVEDFPGSHHAPPEVRDMLDELVETDTSIKKSRIGQVCPKCGCAPPSGDWDFCMKCGTRLKK